MYGRVPRFTSTLIILNLFTHVSATNLTEQYYLCHTDAQILDLQRSNDLIRVDADPTRAALMPGWPQTLITVVLSTYAVVTVGRPRSLLSAFVFKAALPFVTVCAWVISFVFTQKDYASAGWISVNLTTWYNWFLVVDEFESTGLDGKYLSMGAGVLGFFQFVGSLVVAFERISHNTVSNEGVTREVPLLGRTAYQIVDMCGCIPWNDSACLEGGARSEAFRIIQIVQVNYSIVVLIIIACFRVNDDERAPVEERRFVYGFFTLLISIPILIYEVVIATKGRPVVVSGNCMLVELDPKFGFFDVKVDSYWQVLIGLTGL